MGTMLDRTHRELTDDDIGRIAGTYHAWRGELDFGEYADVPGFCAAAKTMCIATHTFALSPGRYVVSSGVFEGADATSRIAELADLLSTQLISSELLANQINTRIQTLRRNIDELS